MTIWWRYLFFDCFKALLGALVAIVALYVAIDLSVHGRILAQVHCSLFAYYGAQLAYRAPFLVPLALVFATLKTVLMRQHHRELLALRVAGIGPLRLLSPYLTVALLMALALYANYQWLFPRSCRLLDWASHEIFATQPGAHALWLADGSHLVYRRYNPIDQVLHDCYWIRSSEDLYRIKKLYPHRAPPLATHVDHLGREEGKLLKAQGQDQELVLPTLSFRNYQRVVHAEALPPTTLYRFLPQSACRLADRDAAWLSQFHAKLALPWVGVLLVLGLFPACTRFTRHTPTLTIIGLAILTFLSVHTAIDTLLILESHQAIQPGYGIWTLLGTLLLACGIPYNRFV